MQLTTRILLLLFSFALTCLFSQGLNGQVPNRNLCGAECLYVAITALKPGSAPKTFREFCRSQTKPSSQGYSMAELHQIATSYGLISELKRLSPSDLLRYCKQGHVILRVSKGKAYHFLLCERGEENHVQVFDSEFGRRTMSVPALQKIWTGESLIVSTSPIAHVVNRNLLWLTLSGFVTIALVALVLRFKQRWVSAACAGLVCFSQLGCGQNQISSVQDQSANHVSRPSGLVVVGDPKVDLGTRQTAEGIQTSFQLKNTGTKPVSIVEIRTSCSCAQAIASKETVDPHDSCNVTLNVDPSKSDSESASITVVTKSGNIRLSAIWRLERELRPARKEFPIFNVDVGGTHVESIELLGNGAMEATCTSLLEKPRDEIEHTARIKEGRVFLEVKVGRKLLPGIYRGVVAIKIKESEHNGFNIFWSLRATAPFSISPDKAIFNPMLNDEGRMHAQSIIDFSGQDVQERLTVLPIPNDVPTFRGSVTGDRESGFVLHCEIAKAYLRELKSIQLAHESGYSRDLPIRD